MLFQELVLLLRQTPCVGEEPCRPYNIRKSKLVAIHNRGRTIENTPHMSSPMQSCSTYLLPPSKSACASMAVATMVFPIPVGPASKRLPWSYHIKHRTLSSLIIYNITTYVLGLRKKMTPFGRMGLSWRIKMMAVIVLIVMVMEVVMGGGGM